MQQLLHRLLQNFTKFYIVDRVYATRGHFIVHPVVFCFFFIIYKLRNVISDSISIPRISFPFKSYTNFTWLA